MYHIGGRDDFLPSSLIFLRHSDNQFVSRFYGAATKGILKYLLLYVVRHPIGMPLLDASNTSKISFFQQVCSDILIKMNLYCLPKIVDDQFLISIVFRHRSMLHQYPNVGGAETHFRRTLLILVPTPMRIITHFHFTTYLTRVPYHVDVGCYLTIQTKLLYL